MPEKKVAACNIKVYEPPETFSELACRAWSTKLIVFEIFANNIIWIMKYTYFNSSTIHQTPSPFLGATETVALSGFPPQCIHEAMRH